MSMSTFDAKLAAFNNTILRGPAPTECIKAVKSYARWEEAFLALCQSFSGFENPVMATAALGTANLAFQDSHDFQRISEMRSTFKALTTVVGCIDSDLAQHIPGAKGFLGFALPVLDMIKARQKAKDKAERAERREEARRAKEEEARLALQEEDVEMTSASTSLSRKRKANDAASEETPAPEPKRFKMST
ncbi:hypothetical protein H0H93_014546, partial [Arthromyces matolae]